MQPRTRGSPGSARARSESSWVFCASNWEARSWRKSDSTRARIKGLRDRLVELSQTFERNIRDDVDTVTAAPGELAGLPADFVATIYHLLGIDPHREEHDQLNRPFQLTKGNPLSAVLV